MTKTMETVKVGNMPMIIITARTGEMMKSIHGEGAESDRDDDDLDAGGGDDDGTTSGWVRDPYVQELLLKQTSNARAAAREKAKLAQLEEDAVTPLYEGCRP